MKIIKKIAAVAMAFAMIGTGTTIAKTVNPQINVGITAYAACSHSNPRVTTTTKEIQASPTGETKWEGWRKYSRYLVYEERFTLCFCNSCGKLLYQNYEIVSHLEWR